MSRLLFLLFLFTPLSFYPALEAVELAEQQLFCLKKTNFSYPHASHQFFLGPELYFLQRRREGGVRQKGTGIGLRGKYERLKANSIFWGGQAFYGYAPLEGSTEDEKLHSRLKDFQVEGTIGYFFQFKRLKFLSIIPFAGYGFFREENKFQSPSPLRVRFITHYQYFTYGYLAFLELNKRWVVGMNLRMRYPWQPHCQIKDDPRRENASQRIKERLSYRLELPIIYCSATPYKGIELVSTPFFELRRYGGRENFPFDFYETKIQIFGINIGFFFNF